MNILGSTHSCLTSASGFVVNLSAQNVLYVAVSFLTFQTQLNAISPGKSLTTPSKEALCYAFLYFLIVLITLGVFLIVCLLSPSPPSPPPSNSHWNVSSKRNYPSFQSMYTKYLVEWWAHIQRSQNELWKNLC